MTARIYLVTDATTLEDHLVKATNQAQAIRHIAESRLMCKVACSLNVANLMQAGSRVQDATTAKQSVTAPITQCQDTEAIPSNDSNWKLSPDELAAISGRDSGGDE